MKKLDTSLYFITDSTGFSEEEFLRRTQAALQGGVTLLQIREKNRTTREYMSLAEKVHALALPYGVPLLIDDRLDVAMAIDAEACIWGKAICLLPLPGESWGRIKSSALRRRPCLRRWKPMSKGRIIWA